MFPQLSEAKLRAGIFTGPQIRQLFKDTKFEIQLHEKEKNAWCSFKAVCEQFLGNRRSPHYHLLVENLIKSYEGLGARMSIKMHFLYAHLEYFPDNCGAYSEEQGERFHQDISRMETRYQGKWNVNMMADYCWCLVKDNRNSEHRRKGARKTFLPQ